VARICRSHAVPTRPGFNSPCRNLFVDAFLHSPTSSPVRYVRLVDKTLLFASIDHSTCTYIQNTAYFIPYFSSALKLMLTLFTQCLSSFGLPNFSPLKMCPKCPPQLLQTISVRIIPRPGSGRCPTAPGMASQNAGHPQPESNLWFALYRGASQPKQE
jgi:hypothetical protein